MAELFLHVELELDPLELAACFDPAREVAAIARQQAEDAALLRGAVLRHGDPVEVYTRPGVEKGSGRHVVLVATRWVADGPEAF